MCVRKNISVGISLALIEPMIYLKECLGVNIGLLEKLKSEKFFLGGGVGVLRGASYMYGVRVWFEKKSENWLVGQVCIYIRGWKEGGWGVGWGPIMVERR